MKQIRKRLSDCDISVAELIVFTFVFLSGVLLFIMLLVSMVFMLPAFILIIAFNLPIIFFENSETPSIKMKRPPGILLLKFADFFYSRKTVDEIFKPIIADWLTEYYESLNEKRDWKARWVSVRYIYSFILAMGLSKLFSLFKSFIPAGK